MADFLLTGDPDDPRFEEPDWEELLYLEDMGLAAGSDTFRELSVDSRHSPSMEEWHE